MTDSSTGGYLVPNASLPAPAEDASLDALFQAAVVGITGLPGAMVRPRWQSGNPIIPEPTVDWCAIGIISQEADAGPWINHQSAGNGSDDYTRHETINVLASFYGPNCLANAATLRDGFGIPQNLEGLGAAGVAFIETAPFRQLPELVNQQWIRRCDIALSFRRVIKRNYPILNILSVPDEIITSAGVIVTATI